MYTYNFEKLEVWQLSRKLVVKVYAATSLFPPAEKFGIVAQIRRSAISVCSNLAEGSSRAGIKDQLHFYNISYSSLMEMLNQLIISADLGWISTELFENLRIEIEQISGKIGALRNSRKL
jgi:four helix bundle protein